MNLKSPVSIAVLSGERHSPYHEHSEENAKEIMHALSKSVHGVVSYTPNNSDEWHAVLPTLKRRAEVAFVATHGTHFFPGGLERLLTDHGMRMVGHEPLRASVTASPYFTASVLRLHSLPSMNMFVVQRAAHKADPTAIVFKVKQYFGFPVLIRPVNGIRSFFGLTAQEPDELLSIISNALRVYSEVVVSRPPRGKIFQCPVVDFGDSDSAFALMPVSREGDLYLSEIEIARMRRLAVAVHRALRLNGYSEVTMSGGRLDEFVVLTVDIIPVFNEGSALRRSLQKMQMSVWSFVERLLIPVLRPRG